MHVHTKNKKVCTLAIAITNNQRTEISPLATDIVWIDKKVGNNLLVVITHKSIKSLDEINLDKKSEVKSDAN